MDVDDIRDRVAAIKRHAESGDYEAARGAEDDLHQDVLKAIMRGARVPAVLAFEALKTTELDFARYAA